MKSDDSDEDAENEAVPSSLSGPGRSPKLPKHDLTMADEVANVWPT